MSSPSKVSRLMEARAGLQTGAGCLSPCAVVLKSGKHGVSGLRGRLGKAILATVHRADRQWGRMGVR